MMTTESIIVICLILIAIIYLCELGWRQRKVENLSGRVIDAIIASTGLKPQDFKADALCSAIRPDVGNWVKYFNGTPLELYNMFIRREQQKQLDKILEKMSEIYNKSA